MLAPPATTTAPAMVDGLAFTPTAREAVRSHNFVGRPAGFGLAALMRVMAGRVAPWRQRATDRAELRDIRFNPSEAWNEANKPFWRA